MKLLSIILMSVSLSACAQSDTAVSDAVRRADLVAVCHDGTLVGEDPVSKRLVWSRWDGEGWVKAGLAAQQVCR